jgi:hypothetical protein
MRAKFKCNLVTDYGTQKQAALSAVYSTEGENADFAKATPSGELKINIDAGVPASEFFTPGKEYYITFSEVTTDGPGPRPGDKNNPPRP